MYALITLIFVVRHGGCFFSVVGITINSHRVQYSIPSFGRGIKVQNPPFRNNTLPSPEISDVDSKCRFDDVAPYTAQPPGNLSNFTGNSEIIGDTIGVNVQVPSFTNRRVQNTHGHQHIHPKLHGYRINLGL